MRTRRTRPRAHHPGPADIASGAGRFPEPTVIGWALDLRFDLVNPEAQQGICQRLREAGVDPLSLVQDLRAREDVADLLSELRAAGLAAQWRTIAPALAGVATLFEQLTAVVAKRGLVLPPGTRDAFVQLVETLGRPARELDLHDRDDSAALPARRAAARRTAPGSSTARIATMQSPGDRSMAAIRQRLMPHIRRVVVGQIQEIGRASCRERV